MSLRGLRECPRLAPSAGKRLEERSARDDTVVCESPTRSGASSRNVDALARRGIGDFAQDGRTARAGRRRKICRALVKRFISEDREGEGFLSVFGHADAGGSKDRHD